MPIIKETIEWHSPDEKMPKETDGRLNEYGECELLVILPICYAKNKCVCVFDSVDKSVVPTHWDDSFLYLKEVKLWAYMPKGEVDEI